MPNRNAINASLLISDVDASATRGARRFALYLFLIVTAFLFTFFGWASFATLDDITRGEAKVIPTGQNKVVQHLEGGIVSAILVREGQTVRPGQVLLRIDSTTSRASVREKQAKLWALEARAARLRAEAEKAKTVVFPPDVTQNAPQEANQELERFKTRKARLESEISILEQIVQQRRQALAEARSSAARIAARLGSMRRELTEMRRDLRNGIVSQSDLQAFEREVNQTAGDLRTEQLAIPRADAALREAEQKIADKEAQFMAEVRKELGDIENQISALRPQIGAGEDKLKRTEVRSPIAGTIKQIGVTTIGAVIKPGQPLVEIVPNDDSLLIEAKINPKDRAFLRPGLPATIKVTAYDFSIYGGLEGSVIDISADAIQEDTRREDTYYRVRIRTNKNFLERGTAKLPIIPGMTASVDILTGKRTVLDHILDPVRRLANESFRER